MTRRSKPAPSKPSQPSPSAPLAAAAVLLAGLSACGIRARSALPDANAGTIITAAEVARSEATTMWEALRRTVRHVRFEEAGSGNPARAHRRGASSIVLVEKIPVFIDGIRVPNLSVLGSLPAGDISRIQVLTGVHATTFYGTNAGDGVILIHTREGLDPPSVDPPSAEPSRGTPGAPRPNE